MVEHFTGPVPVAKFFENFVPNANVGTFERYKDNASLSLKGSDNICKELVKALSRYKKDFCFEDHSRKLDINPPNANKNLIYRPAFALCPPSNCHQPKVLFIVDDTFRRPEQLVTLAQYHEPSNGGERQLAKFASTQFSKQLASPVFTVAIFREKVVFFAWHRSGAVVSEVVPLDSHYLPQFVYQYTWMHSSYDHENNCSVIKSVPVIYSDPKAQHPFKAASAANLNPKTPVYMYIPRPYLPRKLVRVWEICDPPEFPPFEVDDVGSENEGFDDVDAETETEPETDTETDERGMDSDFDSEGEGDQGQGPSEPLTFSKHSGASEDKMDVDEEPHTEPLQEEIDTQVKTPIISEDIQNSKLTTPTRKQGKRAGNNELHPTRKSQRTSARKKATAPNP